MHATAFRAMNTWVDVVLDATSEPDDAFRLVRGLFEEQERRFSRFAENSLLSRLNRGDWVADPRFAQACRLALDAWRETGGVFNPLVGAALCASGYDRSFPEVAVVRPVAVPAPPLDEALDVAGDRVTLRHGSLDLGGIVKGWTVDLAVESLSAIYPSGLVNAGGDLRCWGSEPPGTGWQVGVEDAETRSEIWRGWIDGALATSSTSRRAWTALDGGLANHLIDPATGLSTRSGLRQASVWAEEAWRAEVWAKAVAIDPDKLRRMGRSRLVVALTKFGELL